MRISPSLPHLGNRWMLKLAGRWNGIYFDSHSSRRSTNAKMYLRNRRGGGNGTKGGKPGEAFGAYRWRERDLKEARGEKRWNVSPVII